ncbi:hypothetical protein HLI18_19335 [Rhizobium laguerreae]|nr:hypothetical protein [Rhizobium laguerreae]
MNKAISVPKSAEVLPVTRSSTTIRKLILSNDLSFLMEAHHGLSAAAAERAGFKGLWASGLGGNSSFVSGTTMHNFLESTFGCVAADNILHVGNDAICALQCARSAGMRGALVGRSEDIQEAVYDAV